MVSFFMGVNIGTDKVSAVVVDEDLVDVSVCETPLSIEYPAQGWAEQDPREYWRAFEEVVKCVVNKGRVDPSEIKAISVSAQMMGIVLVDKSGNALSNAIIWLDGRALEESEEVVNAIGAKKLIDRLGGVPTPKDVLPKILWLKRNRPSIYSRAHKIIGIKDYVVFKLTGRYVTDYSCASVTGLLDLNDLKWSQLVIDVFDLDADKYPEIAWSAEPVGYLIPEVASRLGLSRDTLIINGCGDVVSVTLASGSTRIGEVHLHLGPSAWVGVISDVRYSAPEHGMGSVAFIEPGKWLFVAENEVAGLALKWLLEGLLGAMSYHQGAGNLEDLLEKSINTTPPGSEGLLFIPWLYGERSPVPETRLRGVLMNISLTHKLEHVIKAILEGVSFNLKYTLDLFENIARIELRKVPILGEYAQFNSFCHLLSDVLSKPLVRVYKPEQSYARGAAILAMIGSNAIGNVHELKKRVKFECVFKPRSEKVRAYREIYATLRELVPGLIEVYRSLSP